MTLPPIVADMEVLLAQALAEALASLGFVRVQACPRGEAWHSLQRTNALGTQFLRPFVWRRDEYDERAGYFCDIWLEVRDRRVERVIQQCTPHEANQPTALLKFSSSVQEDDRVVDGPEALKTFAAHVKAWLLASLPITEDMAQLDALVNGDRQEVDFMKLLVSGAPLVIAYLGRNPNFDNMVMRADERYASDPGDPVSAPIRIAVHLRTRVKLEPRPAG